MCIVSPACNCDWPTFFLAGSDQPIYGPFQLAEVLCDVPEGRRGHVHVNEDDGFASSNYITPPSVHRVRDAVYSLAQNPDDFRCLKERNP